MSLLALCTVASFVGQGAVQGQSWPPVLETEGDPPALFKPFRVSPRLIVGWNGFTSYQVNVNAQQQNIVGDAANEPSLCIDPANPNRVAIGWRQFDNVTSNFRQAGYGYTTNGGLTWTFPGRIDPGVFRSDPVLLSRYDGTFYYLSLLQTFFDTLYDSTTGGSSWTQVAPADGGDKEWITVDNTNSVGRGNLYQLWSTSGNNYGGRQFTRSTDGGITWLNPINIPNSPIWGTLDVDTSGNLYLGGWNGSTFQVSRSSNAKNSGTTPSFDLTTSLSLGGNIDYGGAVNPGGLTGQMWTFVDRSSASLPNPIYALCSVNVNSNNPADVMVASSINGNTSWNAPVRVNDDLLNSGHYHWMGSLALSPTGRVDAVWNDTRDDSTHNTSALYYAYSMDGGQHFSANIRVSPSFNQSLGYPSQNKMGDYMGVVSNASAVNIAYSATFNSEEDIYYLKISTPVVVPPDTFNLVRGTTSSPVQALAALDNSRFNMAGYGLRNANPMVDLVVQGVSPTLTPKALLFNLVGNDNFPDYLSISFYNWRTGGYETIKKGTSTSADSTYSALATGDLTRFVNQSNGTVLAQLMWAPGHTVWRSNWMVSLNQAVWNVIP